MVSVSSDGTQFSALLSLNTKMQALWLCAPFDPTSFPNILKDKRSDFKKSALKNQCGPAAAELMKELRHTDYAALLDSLKTSLLSLYPVGECFLFQQYHPPSQISVSWAMLPLQVRLREGIVNSRSGGYGWVRRVSLGGLR